MKLPEAGKSSALDFTQSATATDESDGTSRSNGREQLEDVPGGIVKEEGALDRDQRPQEGCVRNRCRFECGGKVVEVDAKEEPLDGTQSVSSQPVRPWVWSTYSTRQNWKRGQSHSKEDKSDSNRWVFGTLLEDVVDLRQLAIPRHLDRRDRFVWVPVNRELESGSIVCGRVAKGSNKESGVNRLGEREKLNGEILLSLSWEAARSVATERVC